MGAGEQFIGIFVGESGRGAQVLAWIILIGAFIGIGYGLYRASQEATKAIVKEVTNSPAKDDKPPTPGVNIQTKKLETGGVPSPAAPYDVEYADCTFMPDFNTELGVDVTLNQLGTFGLYPSMDQLDITWTHIPDGETDPIVIATETITNPFSSETPGNLAFPTLVPTNKTTQIVCSGTSKIAIRYRYAGDSEMTSWVGYNEQPTWSDEVKTQFVDLPEGSVGSVDISPSETIGLGAAGSSNLKYDIVGKMGYTFSNVPVTLINNTTESGKPDVTFKLDFTGRAGVSSALTPDMEFEAVSITGQDMGEYVCLREIVSNKYLELKFESVSAALGDFKLVRFDLSTPTAYSFIKMILIVGMVKAQDKDVL